MAKKQLEKGLDGIVISDYGKGVCTPSLLKQVFGLAKAHQVPTIVDPKGNDWTKYNGATCITPNIKELGQCLGRSLANKDDIVVEGAKEVLKKLLSIILLLRGQLRAFLLLARISKFGIIQQPNKRFLM